MRRARRVRLDKNAQKQEWPSRFMRLLDANRVKEDGSMSQYVAAILRLHVGLDFFSNRYSRKHVMRFDGGLEVPGSSLVACSSTLVSRGGSDVRHPAATWNQEATVSVTSMLPRVAFEYGQTM